MKKERPFFLIFVLALTLALLTSCSSNEDKNQGEQRLDVPDITSKVLVNKTAYLPSQCYTKTEDTATGKTYNPCYTCHHESTRPNYWNDGVLQQSYSMPAPALVNPWTNLFKNKTEAVNAISDQEILNYVNTNNYKDNDGNIILTNKLNLVPAGWDYDKDGEWSGYIPDCYFNFDSEGFDKDKSGEYTGWRAFAYYPFPGTFWPTNGSTDDVLIRLAPEFRQDANGNFSLEIYKLNLAIVEALIKEQDVAIDPVNETNYGVDLDKNGILGTASFVKYDWNAREGRFMYYVGKAKALQESGQVHLAARLYPEGTEFLHSVRYIGTTNNEIHLPGRMKELRYAVKKYWLTYADFENDASNDADEEFLQPDHTTTYVGDNEKGLMNNQGWVYQGFIEDSKGDLRPQSYEETVFCMGCHAKIGATTDNTFAFARKFDAKDSFQKGWYHWTQKSLSGVREPKVEVKDYGMQYEYSFYLMYNKAGDEFRGNSEVIDKFFDTSGNIKENIITALHDDVTLLLNPSVSRALELNKAYRTIVQEQSFIYGRDANVSPAVNVHETVEQNQSTSLAEVNPTMFAQHFNPVYSIFDTGILSPFSEPLKTDVIGTGMTGPDGTKYVADQYGLIQKSSYSLNGADVYFPFPERHTLPVRHLVPNENGASCYTCHRLAGPVPSQSNQHPITPAVTDVVETGMTQLTSFAGTEENPRWSPDGSKIVFVKDKALAVMNSDGSGVQTLTPSGSNIQGWPEWNADSSKIVFWEYNPSTSEYSIKTVTAALGSETTIVGPTTDVLDRPQWNPVDHDHIAYSAKNSGNWDLWIVQSSVPANKYRLTTAADMETNPHWSPDGTKILYKNAAGGDYGLTEEFMLSFPGGYGSAPTTYPWEGPQSIQMSDWSPDGTKIVYTAEAVTGASGSDKVSYLIVVSDVSIVDGKAKATTSTIVSQSLTLADRGGMFSPDSTKVAFWAWDKAYRATLWVYNIATKSLTRITSHGSDFDPQWNHDGTKLLFQSNRKGSMDLWVISVP